MEKASQTYEALLALAKNRGVYVIVRPMPGPLKGKIRGLYVHNKKGDVLPDIQDLILLDDSLSTPAERTYTLAHELAHYQLHKDKLPAYYWTDRTLNERIEAEADRFAQRLLSYVKRRLKDK